MESIHRHRATRLVVEAALGNAWRGPGLARGRLTALEQSGRVGRPLLERIDRAIVDACESIEEGYTGEARSFSIDAMELILEAEAALPPRLIRATTLTEPVAATLDEAPSSLFLDGNLGSEAELASLLASRALSPRSALSDHLALVSPHTSIGRVLSFNVLTRCRTSSERTNNGFGVNESAAQYRERLTRLSARLEVLTAGTSVNVVALQEAPVRDPELLALLTVCFDIEPDAWAIVTRAIGQSSFGLLTAVRRRALRIEDTGVLDPPPDSPQHSRLQSMLLHPVEGGAPVLFANVHLDWSQTAVQELRRLVSRRPALVAGDFNRTFEHELRQLDELARDTPAQLWFPEQAASFSFRRADGEAVATTTQIDGFVAVGV